MSFVPPETAGSSPLTRGKPNRASAAANVFGLIPAHAGKTWGRSMVAPLAWAHPRSRGENPPASTVQEHLAGSSPLTRGKPYRPLSIRPPRRLIPAHAGKTRTAWPRSWACPAHPRSRGENLSSSLAMVSLDGSSPLTRGKRTRRRHCLSCGRLIPAHAGKTHTCRSWPPRLGAHPRSRGENDQVGMEPPGGAGSSPLTRGKPNVTMSVASQRRLIPAHAGKTWKASQAYSLAWAHPRSRGENADRPARRTIHVGSSPLTRGKLSATVPDVPVYGLIPAHAGKTPPTP